MKKILNVVVIVAMIFAWVSVFVIPTSAQSNESKPAYLVGGPAGLILKDVQTQTEPCPPCPEHNKPATQTRRKSVVPTSTKGDVIINNYIPDICNASCAFSVPNYPDPNISMPTWAFVMLILLVTAVAGIIGYLICNRSRGNAGSPVTIHSHGGSGRGYAQAHCCHGQNGGRCKNCGGIEKIVD